MEPSLIVLRRSRAEFTAASMQRPSLEAGTDRMLEAGTDRMTLDGFDVGIGAVASPGEGPRAGPGIRSERVEIDRQRR